ncbi:MAG TPA: hypothetical protein VLQ80_30545 [Candidatus Saccharimonadia bacterium]|nr:hypothetical protein [Candidatus Saccharimonadia bacterium]
MAKLTLSEAARACHVARTTIQRAVKTGRLSLDAEHCVDTSELLRIGYQLDAAALHAATQQDTADVQQDAAPQRSTPQQQAGVSHELQLIRQERDALQRERDLLMQQLDMLRSMHHITQQQLTQAQQMLHDMQHRYDRLLDVPRQVPPPPPRPQTPAVASPAVPHEDPRGAMRRHIIALLQDHPEGLTPAEIRRRLGVERRLADTCLGMLRYGLLQRVERGRYVVASQQR